MKKWICSLLVLALFLSTAGMTAFAEEEAPSRQEGEGQEILPEAQQAPTAACGDSLQWSLHDGALTVSGTGPMYDYPQGSAPWASRKGEIRSVVLESGVTSIGAGAFRDCDSLSAVEFGSGLTELGTGSFADCDGLTELSFPEGFRILGEECLYNCPNLKTMYFAGGMPSFKLNCLWATYATLVYPAQRPWPINHVQQLSEAFQGRIQFRLSDGTDPLGGGEEAPEETEAETVPETTEAVTEPATEETIPVTEAPVETASAETTPAETAPAEETTLPETVPETTEAYVVLPEPGEKTPGSSITVLAILIVLLVASGSGIIALLIHMTRSSRKDFTGDFSEILLEDERKPSRRKPTQAQKAAGKGSGSRKK